MPRFGYVASLSEGYAAFGIRVPGLGEYEVTFYADSLTYVVQEPGGSGGTTANRYSVEVSVNDDLLNAPRFNGDMNAVRAAVADLFNATNAVFNDPGVFTRQFDFDPDLDSITAFYGDPDWVQPSAGYDLHVSLTNVGNWPIWYTAISGHGILVVEENLDVMFNGTGKLSLAHELAHSRGAYDIYAADPVDQVQNPVSYQTFFPAPSIMDYPPGSGGQWSSTTVNIINMYIDTPQDELNYGGFRETLPRMVIRAEDGGAPVSGADVAIYVKGLSPGPVETTPQVTGVSNGAGEYELSVDPYIQGAAEGYETLNLLVEVSAPLGGQSRWGYAFMPLMDVQDAFFAGEDYVLPIDLSVVRGDVDGDGDIDVEDSSLINNYYVGLLDDDGSIRDDAYDVDAFFTAAADVNCDGAVDMTDVLIVYNLANGTITELPCP